MRYEIKIHFGSVDEELGLRPLIVESANGWFVAAEDKPFWTELKLNDRLCVIKHISPRYGDCLLVDRVNEKIVKNRLILIHNGSGYQHSVNCLIPVPANAKLKRRWMTTGPESKKEVSRWRELAPFELIVKEVGFEDS